MFPYPMDQYFLLKWTFTPAAAAAMQKAEDSDDYIARA